MKAQRATKRKSLLRRQAESLALMLACWMFAFGSPSPGQVVPGTISVEGVPEVPRALATALRPYQSTRSASFQGWLADRRQVLILTRFAETNQVHLVAHPGGARTQLTFLADRVGEALPRPGRNQFALLTDEGGAEDYQVALLDLDSRNQALLSDGRSRHQAPVWSRSGRFLAFSGNARNGKDMDLYVADPSAKGPARRFKEVTGDWSVSDWSPDERRVVAIERISINESYVHLVDLESGESQALTPRPEPGKPTVAYEHIRFSSDGHFLFWTTDLDSEFKRLVRYDLTTKAKLVLSGSIPWDVEHFDVSDDGQLVAFSINEDGYSRLHVLDLTRGLGSGQAVILHPARVIALPDEIAGVVSDVHFRRDSHELGFTLSAATTSGDAFSLDADAGRVERWTRSETGGLDSDAFAAPKLIRYPSFDGRMIPAFVYRPPSKFKPPRPVLISIHGGPESQFRPNFMRWLNALVDLEGIVLICPNVRGSAGYGKTYLRLDNGTRREDSVKDIGSLLDWIAKQPELDASRVAVTGGSYGGFMSLSTLTHYSDRLRAGIDVVGISNFVSFLKNTKGYRRDLRRAEYGDERDAEMAKFLENVSPLSSAARIRVPLLVAQGRNDPRVPASESRQIVAEVRKNGGPVWYVVGEDEGHGFAKRKNQDYLQAVETLFLRQYLLSEKSGGE